MLSFFKSNNLQIILDLKCQRECNRAHRQTTQVWKRIPSGVTSNNVQQSTVKTVGVAVNNLSLFSQSSDNHHIIHSNPSQRHTGLGRKIFTFSIWNVCECERRWQSARSHSSTRLGSYALQIYTLNLLIQNWQRQISKNKITTETVSFNESHSEGINTVAVQLTKEIWVGLLFHKLIGQDQRCGWTFVPNVWKRTSSGTFKAKSNKHRQAILQFSADML